MNRRFFELILAIKRKCQCNEERIRQEVGLSQAQFNGLLALDGGREVSGCQFANGMGLSPSRGSRVLNALVVAGYAKTRVSPDDRRTVLISLTPRGRRMREQIMSCAAACEDRIRDAWQDPTEVLHFQHGALIAMIADPDLDTELATERGRLAPLWAEFDAMRRVREKNPEAVSSLLLMLKEGEAVLLEASIREREMARAVMREVISPDDAEIIDGTRHTVNINPRAGDLFRYYPLSHVRFRVHHT